MKNLSLISILALILFVGCDQPRQKRSLRGSSETSSFAAPLETSSSSGSSSGSTSSSSSSSSGSSSSSSSGSTIPSEIDHCNWSLDGVSGFTSTHHHFSPTENDSNNGQFTLCKSKTNELDIYVQLKNPDQNSQICILPTNNQGSKSVYIGEPRCLRVDDNKKIYKVTVSKNRPGNYSSLSVSGVMVMKDKTYFYPPPFYQYALSPDAYLFCSQFLDQYGDPSYCNSFKQVNQYVYYQFPTQ